MPYAGTSAQSTITVQQVTITASVSPTQQTPGGTVTFSGTTSGIPAGEKIYLQIYGSDGTWAEPSPACQPTVGSDGKFSASWTVPWETRGRKPCETWRLRFVYYWYASNEMNLTVYYNTRIRNFTVPSSGLVGQTIEISGYLEYQSASATWSPLANRTVTIYIDTTKIADVTTDSAGFFRTTYTLTSAGTFTVKAVYSGTLPAAMALARITALAEGKQLVKTVAPLVAGFIPIFIKY